MIAVVFFCGAARTAAAGSILERIPAGVPRVPLVEELAPLVKTWNIPTNAGLLQPLAGNQFAEMGSPVHRAEVIIAMAECLPGLQTDVITYEYKKKKNDDGEESVVLRGGVRDAWLQRAIVVLGASSLNPRRSELDIGEIWESWNAGVDVLNFAQIKHILDRAHAAVVAVRRAAAPGEEFRAVWQPGLSDQQYESCLGEIIEAMAKKSELRPWILITIQTRGQAAPAHVLNSLVYASVDFRQIFADRRLHKFAEEILRKKGIVLGQ